MIVITESDNGTKRLARMKVKELQTGLPEKVAAELDRVWHEIWADAVRECPVDTGALVSTIRIVEGVMGNIGGELSRFISETFFDRTIIAGDPARINPKSGRPIDYANLVHDGHLMRDGTFWCGHPFLTIAFAMHMKELEDAVDKAMRSLGYKFSGD